MDLEQRSVRNVIQMPCSNDIVAAAKHIFGVIDRHGNLPIVLVPEKRVTAKTWIVLPTGCACICQRNGRNLGELEPGRHLADWRFRVAYVVTKQACTINFDVDCCATSDNVLTSVDLTLVFNIERPTTFVYTLGATNFNDMLKAVVEEATRALVRSIDHTQIFELRSSAADQLLSVLNRTFKEFGVLFVNATVTGVSLPEDLSKSLEEASKIESQIQEVIRAQDFELKKYNDAADLEIQRIELESERSDADLRAKKDMLEIEMAANLEKAQVTGERKVAEEKQKTETEVTKANAELRDSQKKMEIEIDKKVQAAQLEAVSRKRVIDQWAAEEIRAAELELERERAETEALKKEAEAEAAGAKDMERLRAHELRMAEIEALEKVAKKNKIIVSGTHGEDILNAMVEGKCPY